jgi:phage terminase large subunit-like protein
MTATPDFKTLPQAEQRAVAERLLKIEESGWRPFWCPRPDCDGRPHAVLDEYGDELLVSVSEVLGPEGQPTSDIVYERTLPDGEAEFFLSSSLDPPVEGDEPVGRMVFEPAWAHNHARADQRLPGWNKRWVLFIMSGRGSGKTRTGVEFVTLNARKGLNGAIIGRRGTELVNTHVAEIIKHAHPEFVPEHFASKDILVWPNGAITYLFSAERPDNIRSVNLSYCWLDEAAFMDEVETAWMNAKFATRVKSPGNPIHFLITSTPQGTPWVVKMEDDEDIEVRRVSTYANRINLDPDYLADLEKEYEGTRMGRQELHGEVLRDVEGALWNDGLFKHMRVDASGLEDLLDSMDARIVAVDPAGSKGKRSDATGIIGVGAQHLDENGDPLNRSNFFVMARATLKGTPTEWAAQAFKAAHMMRADHIVAEKNFGGDMVKQVLDDYSALHPENTDIYDENGEIFVVKVTHAVLSKETRAEATVAKYEQGTVTHVTSPHVFGDLSELEKQQVGWVPKSRGGKMPSPNDIDALVWAVRELESKVKYAAQTATSKDVVKKLKKQPGQQQGPGRLQMSRILGRTG